MASWPRISVSQQSPTAKADLVTPESPPRLFSDPCILPEAQSNMVSAIGRPGRNHICFFILSARFTGPLRNSSSRRRCIESCGATRASRSAVLCRVGEHFGLQFSAKGWYTGSCRRPVPLTRGSHLGNVGQKQSFPDVGGFAQTRRLVPCLLRYPYPNALDY